ARNQRIFHPDSLSGNQIRTDTGLDPARVPQESYYPYVQRPSAVNQDDRIERPIAKDRIDEGISFPTREVVSNGGREIVTNVKICASAAQYSDNVLGGHLIDGMRPGIVHQSLKPL